MSSKPGCIALALVAGALACAPASGDDHWAGTLFISGEGNIYKDVASAYFNFTVNDAGKLVGTGYATMPRVASTGCPGSQQQTLHNSLDYAMVWMTQNIAGPVGMRHPE